MIGGKLPWNKIPHVEMVGHVNESSKNSVTQHPHHHNNNSTGIHSTVIKKTTVVVVTIPN